MPCWRCLAWARRKSRKRISTSPRPTPTLSSIRPKRPRGRARGKVGAAMAPPAIHRVTRLDLKVGAFRWPFAEQRRVDIEAHFAGKQRDKPQIWNGRVL